MEMSLPLTPVTFSPSVPKYGTLIPNRIFVGGIANDTTESELKHFFSAFGAVKDCKIILDRAGLSKSYGFVTFESQEDAEKVLKRMSDTLMLRDRKLNIGPAVRKQQMSSRLIEQALSPPSHTLLYSSSSAALPYTLPNGLAIYCAADGNSYLVPAQQQPQAAIYHPTMMSSYYSSPSYYQSQTAAAAAQAAQWSSAASQWRWNSPQPGQGAAGPSMVSPNQYVYPVHPAALMPAELVYPQNGQLFPPNDAGDA